MEWAEVEEWAAENLGVEARAAEATDPEVVSEAEVDWLGAEAGLPGEAVAKVEGAWAEDGLGDEAATGEAVTEKVGVVGLVEAALARVEGAREADVVVEVGGVEVAREVECQAVAAREVAASVEGEVPRQEGMAEAESATAGLEVAVGLA